MSKLIFKSGGITLTDPTTGNTTEYGITNYAESGNADLPRVTDLSDDVEVFIPAPTSVAIVTFDLWVDTAQNAPLMNVVYEFSADINDGNGNAHTFEGQIIINSLTFDAVIGSATKYSATANVTENIRV